METNLRAPFVLMQAMAAALPADRTGNIVNILDERVWNLTQHFVSYTLTKAGLWTLTQTMALALAPRIRVNGVGPGPTLPSPRQSPEQFERQAGMMPLGRGSAPGRGGRGGRIHSPGAVDDRPDDRARRRTASRLGPAAEGRGPGIRMKVLHTARRSAAGATTGTRRMFVRDLVLDCLIGVHRYERDGRQRVRINLSLDVLETGEADRDRLADVVNYDTLVVRIRALAQNGHVNLVETLRRARRVDLS